ncbi:ribonuclease HI family protein [Comamonas testosteroni]
MQHTSRMADCYAAAMQSSLWTVHVDGSALPNPGRMRIGGAALAPNGQSHSFSVALPGTGCNNEAEAHAAIHALRWLQQLGAREVLLYTDNSILAEQLARAPAKPIARLADIYDKARALLAGFDRVQVQWIPRHRNTVADSLARGDGEQAMEGRNTVAGR